MVILVFPNQDLLPHITDFIRDFKEKGLRIHGFEGLNRCDKTQGYESIAAQWLQNKAWRSSGSIQLLQFDIERKMITGCLRLTPNPSQHMIDSHGYNLGYSIRPSCWNRGLGTVLLRQGYTVAETIGMEQVKLYASNPASKRAIEKSGAQAIEDFGDGGVLYIYRTAESLSHMVVKRSN